MAYMLFKYARKKYNERQDRTTDDIHLVPDVIPKQGKPSQTSPQVDGQKAVNSLPRQSYFSSEGDVGMRAEASKRRKRRWKMILGLLLPNFLAAVDVTIVAPAVPIISSHFSEKTPYIVRFHATDFARPS
jgi:hypothetical protein